MLLTAGLTAAPHGLPCFFRYFCEVFQDAKPALKPYTLRRRGEAFDWINELTMTLIQVLAVHTQPQADTARRLAEVMAI